MSSLAEIERAIAKLPEPQVDQLARWLATFRERQVSPSAIEGWLKRARGAATSGVRTDEVMAQTRGEE